MTERKADPFFWEAVAIVARQAVLVVVGIVAFGAVHLGALYLVEGWALSGMLDLFGDSPATQQPAGPRVPQKKAGRGDPAGQVRGINLQRDSRDNPPGAGSHIELM